MERTHLAEMPTRWDGHIITFGFDLVDGRMVVTEIALRREDGRAVRPVRPPLARLGDEALRELRTRWAPQILHLRPSETAVQAAETLVEAPGVKRGRPALYGVEHWDEVLAVYAKGGTLAVAEEFSLSYATAWKWSQAARQAAQEPRISTL
jgi:hypothetical protein